MCKEGNSLVREYNFLFEQTFNTEKKKATELNKTQVLLNFFIY